MASPSPVVAGHVWVSRAVPPTEDDDGFGLCYGRVDEALTTLTVRAERAGTYNVLLIGTRKDADAVAFFDGGGGVEYLGGGGPCPASRAQPPRPPPPPPGGWK